MFLILTISNVLPEETEEKIEKDTEHHYEIHIYSFLKYSS